MGVVNLVNVDDVGVVDLVNVDDEEKDEDEEYFPTDCNGVALLKHDHVYVNVGMGRGCKV